MIAITLITVTLVSYGFYFSNKSIYRLKDFKELKKALLILEGEITFGNENLYNATKKISKKIKEPLSSIFLEFSNKIEKEIYIDINILWNDSIDMYKDKLYFQEDEVDEIKSLGKALGNGDVELQLKNILILINYIDSRIEELQNKSYKEAKMYKSISLLFSALVTIILI